MTARTLRVFCLAACVAVSTAACGSQKTDTPPAAAPAPGKKVDPATAGSIAGQVKFDGVAPPAEVIRMNTDRKCTPDGANPTSDALVIGADKGVKNTFVYVKDGLDAAYTFDVPSAPVVLDQKGCMYSPHVFGVRVGQPVEIVNSDPTMHNIHALPMVNGEFNHGQPKQGQRTTETFTAPEIMVRFKCDVHAWMIAWAGVVPHPFFAVTDSSGAFKIPGLPPGKYTVEAWHEKLGRKTMEITVGPGQAQTAAFTFTAVAK